MFSSGVPTSKFGSRWFPRGYRHQILEIIDVFLRGSNITVAILGQGIRRVHASELTFGHLFSFRGNIEIISSETELKVVVR